MADSKLTGLTEDTSVNSSDLGYTIEDPSGTPVSKKATWLNILKGAALGVLTSDGDLFTRASGALTRITRASLAADTAFSSLYAPSDTAYDATTWNGDTDTAPSKNAMRDLIATIPIRLIDEQVLGSPAASIDFSSIPATYRHLELVVVARGTTAAAATELHLRVNNDSGANYHYTRQVANQTTVSCSETGGDTEFQVGFMPAASIGAAHAVSKRITIHNYAGTTFAKMIEATGAYRNSDTDNVAVVAETVMGQWESTSAINRITLIPQAGNFDTGTVVSLYGLLPLP